MTDVIHSDIFWTAVGAVAQGIASIMAIAALLYSMITFRNTLKISHYTELDRMYFDLLKVALERPHLINSVVPRNKDAQREYEIYAYMTWNFLEAIYDRCEREHRDKHLWDTWKPVFVDEIKLHGQWLSKPENKCRFKPAFCEFVREFPRQIDVPR